MSLGTKILNNKEILDAVNKRRNFAIISHPDAGKTTLTEKLLLYGGAIQQAGAVKARGNQRKATSDWMELEKQRGISINQKKLKNLRYICADVKDIKLNNFFKKKISLLVSNSLIHNITNL